MFAQALDAYRKGEKYWFDGEEVASITDNNKNYEIVASEEELLLKFFTPYRTAWNFVTDCTDDKARLRKEIAAKGSGYALMTFTEIKAAIMAKVPQVKIFDRTLHQVMINNGFYNMLMRVGKNVARLYPVCILMGDEIQQDMKEEVEQSEF
jgi:predicted P-loop ATPase